MLCGILEYGGRVMCYSGFKGVGRILMCYHFSARQLFILFIRGNASLGSMGENKDFQ